MFCWHCGVQIPDDAQFCPKCGQSQFRGSSGGTEGSMKQIDGSSGGAGERADQTGGAYGETGERTKQTGGAYSEGKFSESSDGDSSAPVSSPQPDSGGGVTTGTFTYEDGHTYEGEIRDGLPNGSGVITFPSGERYEGEVLDGKRDGLGVNFFANGDSFEGYYKNDRRNGSGVYVFASGTELYGTWVDGKMDGEVHRIRADGTESLEVYQNGERISSEEVTGNSSESSIPAKPADTELLIPDFGAFCGGDVDFYLDERAGTTGRKKGYSFKPNSTVVDEYLALLESDYQFTQEKTHTNDIGNSTINYGFAYTGSEHVSSVDQSFKGLECEVTVTQWDDKTQVVIRYGYELSYTDPGVRSTEPTEADKSSDDSTGSDSTGSDGSGGFVPDASKLPCLTCNGTKKCPVCGGDGYLWSSASGKEDRNCWKCGNYRGTCPTCGGSGHR